MKIGVTYGIDRERTDIYHVACTTDLVGHSSTIIGNPQDGYKAYNLGGSGGGYTTGTVSETIFKTPQEALAALSKGFNGEYDSIQKWDTTSAQDKKAQKAKKKFIDDNAPKYNPFSLNCTKIQ